jgi:hypothetical protein
VTNLMVTPERVGEIVNRGGRARQESETLFNVGKNGGCGLEHACCANEQASRNRHVLMPVASVLGQVLIRGVLRRLTRTCRKVTDVKLAEMLPALRANPAGLAAALPTALLRLLLITPRSRNSRPNPPALSRHPSMAETHRPCAPQLCPRTPPCRFSSLSPCRSYLQGN